MKNLQYIIVIVLAFFLSCKKLVEVGTPQNQLTTDKVFSDTASATAAMVNVYSLYNNNIDPNYNKYMGVYTDELNDPSSSSDEAQFNSSKLSATNGAVGNFWSYNYNTIYSCNQIIEQLKKALNIPAAMAGSLTGEAKFLRAYSNFYLVNSFGPVPLILTTNVDQTSKTARSDTASVYTQIIQDLKDAQTILPVTYIGTGKVRANQYAAIALLARAYLYQRKWSDAETQSSAVINSGLYSLDSLSSVFLANSNETILAFWTQNGYITDAANLIPNSGSVPLYPVTASLLSAFENGDLRKSTWLQSTVLTSGGATNTYYYPYKYHNSGNSTVGTPEYLVALRLAEQYLIRAEARAQQGNIVGSVQDINIIRVRAGLTNVSSAISQTACLNFVEQEWRVEFFVEWGHRYLELKRTGRINQVMNAYKPTWLPQADLLPIPKSDLTYNPFLTQNSGY